MEVILTEDYNEMSKISAGEIARQVRKKPNSVIGLATGSTPLGTYKELIRLHKEEGLDFSKVITFNLDEYLGLPPAHKESYNFFMWENLFKHININPENVHVPQGMVEDAEEFCEWYEKEIEKAGGIDLQLLGIGSDGHIAFNEPGSSFGSRTRVKTLEEQTIEDNSRFFNSIDEVPHFAITMGVGTILEARKIVLAANGKNKAQVCARFIEGPIDSQITASALQLHPHAVIVLDEAASSQLKRKKYYNWIRDNKHMVKKYLGR
ncbi:MAG: glucosamine-6-phosphate deaminase [Spirochaetes bacterium]|nr:glucosamine-6-phosphate deaminase [Spirochaetota bacterium]